MNAKTSSVLDQRKRDAAVAERKRNVLIDAGAGTGKTTILVDRMVEMLAPTGDVPSIPIERLVAVTFTRRAAGELRLRIRERILSALGRPDTTSTQRGQLRNALGGLDTAYVGTIHSFADRLLRLRPVEAQLSPSYEVVEDEDELTRETFDQLLYGAQAGTLAEMLEGTPEASRAAEATRIVLAALSSGIRPDSLELEYFTRFGLDALVAGFIRHRDNPPPEPANVEPDLDTFGDCVRQFVRFVQPLAGTSPGVKWLKWAAARLEEASRQTDPTAVCRSVFRRELRSPSMSTKKDGFDGDEDAFRVWKAYDGDTSRKTLRSGSLREDMLAPLRRWISLHLVRLFPVVVALYERVKEQHRVLDQVDLLIKLRNLLAKDLRTRAFYQSLFDHVLIDEFQDTDPLQAELILYLCEEKPECSNWRDVRLAQGKLTVVGDPKQSIYRFRRADIATYDQARAVIERGDPLRAQLSVNFRSTKSLISFFNDRFEDILGKAPSDGVVFDTQSGNVYHQSLRSHRDDEQPQHVHVLPFERDDDDRADAYRQLEGAVTARYLRWLVELSGFEVRDRVTNELRRVAYGDIAILALATPPLAPIFPELDRLGVPYAARGGRLFLEDPLHQQFLLGLRAVADRDDGVAEAALLRPPFFAIDLVDLLRARRKEDSVAITDGERARAASELVRELRSRRFERSPGETARDLLERTAFGRAVALGANGAQRLERLRELCLVLGEEAAHDSLDYDAVTARLRSWVTAPIQLEPPRPVGHDAVQIMTVHQAKGLEFPVVVLWDGRCLLRAPNVSAPWRVDSRRNGWLIDLDRLKWEEPEGSGLNEREKLYANAERRRTVYVAATRARDLLVLPQAAGSKPEQHVPMALLSGAKESLLRRLPPYRVGAKATWAEGIAPAEYSPPNVTDLESEVTERWGSAVAQSMRPRFRPVAVTGHPLETEDQSSKTTMSTGKREGRFGALFGDTVHRAIGNALRDSTMGPRQAVEFAATHTGLADKLDEATADVVRALDALERESLRQPPGPTLRIEYPLAGPSGEEELLVGFADLVASREGEIIVLDFKTDAPPSGVLEVTHADYVAQVKTYARLLEGGGLAGTGTVRCGLLFTADGQIRWV